MGDLGALRVARARRRDDDSDLDFLVVERAEQPTAEEMVRLRDALPPLGVPVT